MTTLLICCCLLAADDTVQFPKPIRLGDLEVTPIRATIGKPVLKTITGKSNGPDPELLLMLKLKNHSSVRRFVFEGWPHHSGIRPGNFSVKDEHGNSYRHVTYGLGSRPYSDNGGDAIEPGATVNAVLVIEKPVAAATSLIIDLDGEAVEQKGRRLRWELKRSDWEARPKSSATPAVESPEDVARAIDAIIGKKPVPAKK